MRKRRDGRSYFLSYGYTTIVIASVQEASHLIGEGFLVRRTPVPYDDIFHFWGITSTRMMDNIPSQATSEAIFPNGHLNRGGTCWPLTGSHRSGRKTVGSPQTPGKR